LPSRRGNQRDISAGQTSLTNAVAILATKHGKERVIAPLLRQALGLRVEWTSGLDTDRFGTFSREIERPGSPLETARAKVAAAFEHSPGARVGIASEGSFGPHPTIPFVPLGLELVLLVDRETGFELTGHDATLDTNFRHAVVTDVDGAIAFAERSGFPGHGLIVIGCVDGQPAPRDALVKDLLDRPALEAAVRTVLARSGAAVVETDMRAHRNPTRMRAIERATADLVRRYQSRCPACGHRGFDVTELVPGLPCASCGAPTRDIQGEILSCSSCGHRETRKASRGETADPGRCDYCNP
jgi:ribosomal protein L37E